MAASASGSFDTPAVGTGKPVSITGISLAGADAGNYTLLNTSAATTASITQAPSGTFSSPRLVNAMASPLLGARGQQERDQRCAAGLAGASGAPASSNDRESSRNAASGSQAGSGC